MNKLQKKHQNIGTIKIVLAHIPVNFFEFSRTSLNLKKGISVISFDSIKFKK